MKDFIKAIDKLHLALYNEKYNKLESDDYGYKLIFDNDEIEILTFLASQVRLKFSDFEGPIDKYTHVFGEILGNSDNCCDTSDFIILTETQSKDVAKYILNSSISSLQNM